MSGPAEHTKGYRAYLLSREDHIIKSIEINSANDDDARAQAKRHAGQYAVELWDRARKLEHFPSKS